MTLFAIFIIEIKKVLIWLPICCNIWLIRIEKSLNKTIFLFESLCKGIC